MVDLQGICAGYGGREVLHCLSAHFESGRFTALVGPNGCGKSTLLRVIAGLLTPEAGYVHIDGASLPSLSRHTLARTIAFLPQSRPVPRLTVLRFVLHGRFPYLGYPRRYRAQDLDTAHRALADAGIEALAEKNMDCLSGGERQKAYIAMALAQDARLLLLDEPGTFLDIRHQFQIMHMAQSLCAAGKTVIMVTHELEHALRFAGRICLMDAGRVVQLSAPGELTPSLLSGVFGVRAMPENGVWRFDAAP